MSKDQKRDATKGMVEYRKDRKVVSYTAEFAARNDEYLKADGWFPVVNKVEPESPGKEPATTDLEQKS